MSDTHKAGFCRVCGRNVWLTHEGNGVCGHPAREIEGVYETSSAEEATAPAGAPEAGLREPQAEAPAAGMTSSKEPTVPEGRKRSPVKVLLVGAALVAIAALAVVLLYPRPNIVVTNLQVPQAVLSQEEVVVTVQVANEGRAEGDCELMVLVDDVPAGQSTVTVEAGAEKTFNIGLPGMSPGSYRVGLAEWEEFRGTVRVMTPAEFVIDSVDISPRWLDINKGKEATVLVQLSNLGEAGGQYTLDVTVDGTTCEERPLFVEGGQTAQETFTVAVDKPGECEIAVNGVCVDLMVYKVQRPGNGTAIVNEVGGGSNELRITNRRDTDALVVLSEPGEGKPALLSVYVHAEGSHTVRGIEDGTYACYYAHGSEWCAHARQFTTDRSYGRFEEDSRFTSSRTQYSIFTVEFGIVEGPGSPTESVNEEDFPTM